MLTRLVGPFGLNRALRGMRADGNPYARDYLGYYLPESPRGLLESGDPQKRPRDTQKRRRTFTNPQVKAGTARESMEIQESIPEIRHTRIGDSIQGPP